MNETEESLREGINEIYLKVKELNKDIEDIGGIIEENNQNIDWLLDKIQHLEIKNRIFEKTFHLHLLDEALKERTRELEELKNKT